MTTKHTPGPWRVNEFGNGQMEVLDAAGNSACVKDNAHLIAAAPELLAALELIQEIMQREEIAAAQNNSSLSRVEREAKMLARAAIAKATQA